MTPTNSSVSAPVALSRRRTLSQISRAATVLSHLFEAAQDIGDAELSIGLDDAPRRIRLGFPCPATHTIEVYFDGPVPPPAPRQEVTVRFAASQLTTTVHDAPAPDRWRLRRPPVILRFTTRTEPRLDVSGEAGFRISLNLQSGKIISCPLLDLSSRGLAFRIPLGTTLKRDMRLVGTLHLRAHNLPIMLEVRALQHDGQRCGASLRGLSTSSAAVLQRTLSQLTAR